MVFGPDGLPLGCGRTDLALRLLSAQPLLGTDVRCVLVISDEEEEETLATLRAAGALENVRVLVARTELEGIVAASAACSIAQACEDDVLVVVDSLRPHLQLWKETCDQLLSRDVPVTPEEEGSQQRGYYSRLVERAARRKAGGSVTLILLQPSVSVLAEDVKDAYTLADFEAAGFTNTACDRVKLLEEKGIRLTQEVLIKVGIPLPGSDHPAAGKGQRSAQHLEELTSLVDGHVDLRENFAAKGRVPPIDPSNSLTRIGVGSTKLRPLSQTSAMAEVCGSLRLELASAADYVHCEEKQKRRAEAYLAVLQQPDPRPLPVGEEVALLHAASTGALDDLVASCAGDAARMRGVLEGLLAHLQKRDPGLLARITATGLLGDDASKKLGELTAGYFEGSKTSERDYLPSTL
jgi:F0F1-type ATP synthase alpha subunit